MRAVDDRAVGMSDKLFHVVRCGFYTIRKNDPILSVDLPDQHTFLLIV